ncbi:TetR/AcrR family transcriptional regulator [Rheinheimera fenheensis]|uniref:TetR/AcrR family transcriptional regulator n=1 Tax=Rheinheimera fenheensis TaxID=3152295 RepID=UPI003260875D
MDSRRQEILNAALRCFSMNGFHRTTMRDIFQESGLSAGAVYNYFPNKKALIEAVAQKDRETNESAFAGAMTKSDAVEAFNKIIDLYFNSLKEMAKTGEVRIGVTVAAEAAVDPEIMASVAGARSELRAALEHLANQLVSSPERQVKASAFAELLLSVYQGLQMSLAMGEKVDVESVADLLRRMKF